MGLVFSSEGGYIANYHRHWRIRSIQRIRNDTHDPWTPHNTRQARLIELLLSSSYTRSRLSIGFPSLAPLSELKALGEQVVTCDLGNLLESFMPGPGVGGRIREFAWKRSFHRRSYFRDLSPAPVTCDSSFPSDYSISFIPVECDNFDNFGEIWLLTILYTPWQLISFISIRCVPDNT